MQSLRSGLRRMEQHALLAATTFNNTYQTMPDTRWNYWNLILFNEHEKEDG